MIITDYLGNSPKIKIIEFLIFNREKAHSISEIILGANVKHRTLVIVLKDLLEMDLVFIARKVGKSNLYQINEFHSFIQALVFETDLKRKEEARP